VFGDIGDATSVGGRLHEKIIVVEGEVAWDVERDLFAAFRKLPTVALAAGQTLADATMGMQVIRRVRPCSTSQVGRSGHGDEPDVTTEFHRHHVFRHGFQQTYSGIETLFHDIDEPTFRNQIKLDVGIEVKKARYDVLEQDTGTAFVGVDPQCATRRATLFRQGIESLIQFLEDGIELF